MAPDNIWATCLDQLKLEMSKSTFETYLKGTSAHLNQKEFVVLVPDPEKRDWCAARLTRTIFRMVQALTENQEVTVNFEVQPLSAAGPNPLSQASEPLKGVSPENEPGDALDPDKQPLELSAVVNSLTTLLVRPEQIVVVPKYLLRFTPLIGADRFWMYIAFRQVRYLKTWGNPDQTFTARADEIYKWCGMSRASFWRHLDDPELGWLIEKLPNMGYRIDPEGGAKQAANRYRIAIDIPLTPMDADALKAFLIQAQIREHPVQALETAVAADLDKILPYPSPWPTGPQKEGKPQILTVAGIVNQFLAGIELDPKTRAALSALSEKLSEKILRPSDSLHISWYFLQSWLPLLGSGPALLVAVLRSLGYYSPITGETRDEIWVNGGYAQLAQYLGLSREKTIVGWFASFKNSGPQHKGNAPSTLLEQARTHETQSLLSKFLTRLDGRAVPSGGYAWKFHVLISADPLTPADEIVLGLVKQCLERCEQAGVLGDFIHWLKEESVQALLTGKQGNSIIETLDPSDNSIFETLVQGANSINETLGQDPIPSLRLAPGANSRIETLNSIFHSIFETLDLHEIPYLRLLKILAGLTTFRQILEIPTTQENSANGRESGPVGEVWGLSGLLETNRVSQKRRLLLLKSERDAIPFVSWLLYAASGKGAAIKDPVGHAISKLTENPGQGAGLEYDRLAALGPQEFHVLMTNDYGFNRIGFEDWKLLKNSTNPARLSALAQMLGLPER